MSGYDVLVIGAGPGGYVAAIRAAQLGLKAAVVERAHLGGICLNWGCIPTKSLLHGTETLRAVRGAERLGIAVDGVRVDAQRMFARSREVSSLLNGGVAFLLKKNKVDVIWGEAEIIAPGEVAVRNGSVPAPKGALGEGTYAARHVIVATGASPRRLPGLEPDGHTIWTYFEALQPPAVPASMIVVGSGAIGVEFACVYAALGTRVALVEAQGAVLPLEDPDISEAMAKALKRQGVDVVTGVTVTAVERGGEGAVARLSDGSSHSAEKILSAAGVVANVAGLGLERLGVALRGGTIETDGAGRTSVPGIHAIGDVAGPPMLAHKAEHEAIRCIEAIAAPSLAQPGHAPIPACVFAHPQVASIGLTEPAARASGREIRVGRFSFRANGKAVAIGEPDGMVKTIFDAETDRLVGAHLIGPNVAELVHGFAVAMELGATAAQLAQVVFPHPTLSEALQQGVLAAEARAIHA
jgi:dihydrolipoamide dehydrogenase